MKNLKVTLAAMMIALFTVFGATNAKAQLVGDITGALQQGLVNINVQDVIDDVTVDNVLNNNEIITLDNVLNNNDVDVDITALNNFLNGIQIDNVLNNLLRDANIITDNQIVVGVLSGAIVVADKKAIRTKK